MFIDTHAHLYHAKFGDDRTEMVQRALDAEVTKLFLPNIDLDSAEAMNALADAYPDVCFPMMGLHPGSVGESNEKTMQEVERELRTGRYFAVGEIGIDLYWDKTWLAQQQEVFRQQVRWAKELALPIVIHCRESFDEVIAIVEEENDATLEGVFHCFTGGPAEAEACVQRGALLSISGIVTFPSADDVRGAVLAVPLTSLMVETDAPYLTPHPWRGSINAPYLVPLTVRAMAAVASAGGSTPPLAEPADGADGEVALPPIVAWLLEQTDGPSDYADFSQAMVLTAPRALDERACGGDPGDAIGALDQDRALGLGRVVLGKAGDLVEELGAVLVVEPDRGEFGGCGREP